MPSVIRDLTGLNNTDEAITKAAGQMYFGDLVSGWTGHDPFQRFRLAHKHDKDGGQLAIQCLELSGALLPIYAGLRQTHWNPLEFDTFEKPPPAASPLRDLSYFAVLGIDIKITPDGALKIIEINGINSGMKGYAKTGTKAHDQDDHRTHRADKLLDWRLEQYGGAELAYLGTLMTLGGQRTSRLEPMKDLVFDQIRSFSGLPHQGLWERVHPDWHTQYFMAAKYLLAVERCFENKITTDERLEAWRDLKPHSFPATAENLERLIGIYNPRFVVIKDRDGSQGKNVEIVPAAEAAKFLPEPWRPNGRIIEPFVESREILSSRTRNVHDGCARYVCLAEVDKAGDVRIRHYGGYWRLCALPLSDYGDVNAMRANLAQKAIPEAMNEEDQAMMALLADEIVPRLVRSVAEEVDPTLSPEASSSQPPAAPAECSSSERSASPRSRAKSAAV